MLVGGHEHERLSDGGFAYATAEGSVADERSNAEVVSVFQERATGA